MTETFQHYTVMLKETVDGLNIKPDGVYVDCTLGGAGHSEYLLSQLSSKGHLYAFDQDQKAIDHAKLRLASYVEQGMVTFIKANFRELEERLSEYVDKVDGILYDLGVSSPQLDEAERGFSYHQDAPLDMRMDQSAPLSAYHVINEYSYHELVKIFFRYGEEKFSKQIAREIGVITFHSLEDRIVKSMFKEYSTVQDLPPGLPVIPDEFQPELKVITRKPILPSEEELAENNRSRSAKLRIAEKIRMKEE